MHLISEYFATDRIKEVIKAILSESFLHTTNMPSFCDMDIEDFGELITSLDLVPKEKRHSKDVKIRRIPRKQDPQEAPQLTILSSIIPGTQTIYVKTWGCTHNSSDAEYMAGQLAAQGYNMTDDKLKADLWLLNSCTVKSPAEDQFRNEIVNGKKLGKHVVVAGYVQSHINIPSATSLVFRRHDTHRPSILICGLVASLRLTVLPI